MEDKDLYQFVDGFNKGYLLKKYKTELHEQVTNSLKDQAQENPLIQGMVKGAEEAELEQQANEFERLRNRDERDLEK